ncbi:MAG: MarR family transcriptional regulator [Flavipsychrobacter sp.]|nr:MarR family transcriptional regulator [Flavipsychrobacter sp.]
MKLEQAIQTTKFKNEQHKATINILYTTYWLKTHVSSSMKQYDITMEQFNVLRILRGRHPEKMCVKNIGSRMIEKSSNVPRIIDRLEAKKMVERVTSAEDKRESLISLTEKGLINLDLASKTLDEINARVIGITEEEAAVLNNLLDKMRKID